MFGQPWPPLQPPFVAVERRNEEDGREERDDGFESEKGGRESCVCREGEGVGAATPSAAGIRKEGGGEEEEVGRRRRMKKQMAEGEGV